jgi:hypothetical protein
MGATLTEARAMGIDRWTAVLGTAGMLAALVYGAVTAAPPEASATGREFDSAGRVVAGGVADAAERADVVTVDALKMDPQTLELIGVEAHAAPGTVFVNWKDLKYEYEEGLANLPEPVRAIEGKTITIVGFMMPIYEWEDIHEFSLVASHWSCCFGVPPTLSGVVNVTLAEGQSGLMTTFEPLKVVGTFHAREVEEAGYLVSIYEIRDARVEVLPMSYTPPSSPPALPPPGR